MALVHIAMHDTAQGFYQQYATYQTGLPAFPNRANVLAAISGAAYTVFNNYFGSNVVALATFNSLLIFQQDTLTRNGVSAIKITNGFNYGATVATSLIASRANDGFNVIPAFVPQTGPGFWRPTPPNFAPGAGAGWGDVSPWGLTQPITSFFPVDGNTYFTNATRYIIDYAEVLGRGRDVNNFANGLLQRTGVETFVGVFWANDFGGTSLPPGQYLETAQLVGRKLGLSVSNYTRLLAVVSTSIANCNIVAWKVKYTALEWRPVAAIIEAGTDAYTETQADVAWVPLSITSPAFPDYISGHATFGYSLSQALRKFTGSNDYIVSIPSDNLPQVLATYRRLSDVADDNALSRIYLGVHFRAALTDAQQVGESIADNVYNNLFRPL
jgi:hypothetical protein